MPLPDGKSDPVPAPPAAALDTWPLDEAFLAAVLDTAAALGPDVLVTLDVFDTALTRLVDSPADLFAAVERDLVDALGPPAAGYAARREHAERDARARLPPGREDLDLDAILAELVRAHPPLRPHRDRLVRVELDAERRFIAATPDILALCSRLDAAGVPFGFVSDMYLSERDIAGLLRASGFGGWRFLLVSSATGRTKHSGRQWDVLRERHGSGPILHVGDDRHADEHTPRTRNIAVLPYGRARSARRTGARLDPAILPFSVFRRDAVLRARATLPVAAAPAEPDPGWWHACGRVLGGLVLAAFVRWLEERARRHRIDTLHFLARDGFLLRKAWHAAGAPARTGLADRYLLVSRRTLNLARGAVSGSGERLDQASLSFLSSSDGTLTVSGALSRIGLDADPELRAAAVAAFGDLSARLEWPDGNARLEQLLARHPAAVHRRLSDGHAALMAYLRGEGLLVPGARHGLVDLGWHAGLQRSLRVLLEAETGAPASLHGFYYGLWPDALANLWGAGPAEAAFCSPFRGGADRHALGEAVAILEELHTAPHGTVLGYRPDGAGGAAPVLADSPAERDQHHRVSRHFQEGALDTVRRLFAGERVAGLSIDEITPACALSAIAATVLSPEPDELWAFSTLGHCATFDHDRFRPLVPGGGAPDGEDARLAAFGGAGWRFGTLCAWVDRAPDPERAARRAGARGKLGPAGGPPAAPPPPAALRAWARFMLGPSWDPRPLRRFF